MVGHGCARLLTHAAPEDEALHSTLSETIRDPLEMFRPLRQDERVTSPSLRSDDIGTDLSGAVVVVNDPAKVS